MKKEAVCRDASKEKLCGSGIKAFCVPKELKCPITSLNLNNLLNNNASYGITYQSGNTAPMTLFMVRQSKAICMEDYTMLLRHS